MGLPPSDAGGVQVTVTEPSPGEAFTPVTGSGTVAGAWGVTGPDGVEVGPDPMALTAVTVQVTVVPLVTPVTVAVVEVPDIVIVLPSEQVTT